MSQAKDLGLQVTPPDRECADPRCPFHGQLSVRGAIFEGEVVRARMQGSIVVSRQRLRMDEKFQRYARSRSRLRVHAPPCLDLQEGDTVRIGECRPLSKNISFVALERRNQR